MKSRLLKKLIAYGFFPFMILFFSVSPLLGLNVAHAQGGCDLSLGGNFDALRCVGTLFTGVAVMFNMILGLLLYLIGMVLDFAIQFSIAGEYGTATGTGGLYRSETVNVAWNLLRDIINMSFIFILLYVAIGTVLNIQNINWKKQVSQIIIAAILVNFSLFITRVVIDAGNIVANGFYTELTACPPNSCLDGDGIPRPRVGISERFMGALGIAQITELRTDEPIVGDQFGWTGYANELMKTVVIIIAMWVFLSVAIIFIARTFALVFILVLSPIGIAGSSLPLLGGFAKKWREALFKYAMLGVVFLFFTFVVLTFAVMERDRITAIDIGVGEANRDLIAAGLGEGDDDDDTQTESLFIMYALVIAGLIMSLRLTKNLSGEIGKFGDNIGKAAVGIGLGAATGGAALVGRQTVGRAALATLESKRGEKIKEEAEKGNRRKLAQYNVLKSAAGGTFDVRTTKLGTLATEQASKLAGNIAGVSASVGVSAGKGGRTAKVKEGAEKYAKSLEDFSPKGLRRYAEISAEKAEKNPLSPATGIRKKRAAELRKMADRKETTKEERERTVAKVAGNLRGASGNGAEVGTILGRLKSNELRSLPPEILRDKSVINNLHIGDLQSIKDSIDRATKKEIYEELYTSPTSSTAMKNYLENPDNGWSAENV